MKLRSFSVFYVFSFQQSITCRPSFLSWRLSSLNYLYSRSSRVYMMDTFQKSGSFLSHRFLSTYQRYQRYQRYQLEFQVSSVSAILIILHHSLTSLSCVFRRLRHTTGEVPKITHVGKYDHSFVDCVSFYGIFSQSTC